MNSLNFREGYIFNQNDEVAAKLFTRTLYIGTSYNNITTNNCFEIWQLNSNDCIFYVNNEKYELRRSDIMILSNKDHYGYDVSVSHAQFTILKIHTQAFKKLTPKNQLNRDLSFFESHNVKNVNLIKRGEQLSQQISSSLANLKSIFFNKEPDCELAAFCEIVNIIIAIARHTNYSSTSLKSTQRKTSKPDTALLKSIDYINTHLSDELTLEKISEVCGLSPNYFSNLFRVQTGIKLWDYVSEQRISLATKIFSENPTEPVISVALRCGYNNCPNFNRAFKKYTGQTPKKYKTSIVRQETFNEK